MPTSNDKFRRIWRHHIQPILIIVLVFTTVRSVIVDWNDVPTPSMEPTILAGDRVLVNKLAYGVRVPFSKNNYIARWSQPKRGDIIVFFHPESGVRLVKRAVAVAGDTLQVIGEHLYINGKELQYTQLSKDGVRPRIEMEQLGDRNHPIQIMGGGQRSYTETMVVPEGHVFAMGDNRSNSQDSRWFGFVSVDRIAGRAFATAWSFEGSVTSPRWGRFFRSLP